jgi:diguanylate cyclase (GGDEF)-like protein
VTISAGVAEFPTQGGTRDEVVKSADEALYAAKQTGRNRVVTAEMLRRTF